MKLPTVMPDACVETINWEYYQRLLHYHGLEANPVGRVFKVKGFDQYNFLIDINSVFSNSPKAIPIDRTGFTRSPVKWSNRHPWQAPQQQLSLPEAMQQRVNFFHNLNCPINVFWSGGIDSTSCVTAFLKYLPDPSRLRIFYSPWSNYEHPKYLDFVRHNFPTVELFDYSGEHYLDLAADGVWVSGNSGDEMHASIDESFLDAYGIDILHRPWQDFFRQQNNNAKFIEFCEQFFAHSGLDIRTVLEARWWFYAACKVDSLLREITVPFLLSGAAPAPAVKDIYGFFHCNEYAQFVCWNIDQVVGRHHNTWKQLLKDFCYEFDQLEDWWRNKIKFASVQFAHYHWKKIALNNRRHLVILDTGQFIATPSLPLLSQKEFDAYYGSSLATLFNEPDFV